MNLEAVHAAKTQAQLLQAVQDLGGQLGDAIAAWRERREEAWGRYLALRRDLRLAAHQGLDDAEMSRILEAALDLGREWGFEAPR